MEDKIIFKGEYAYQFRLDMVYIQYIMHDTFTEYPASYELTNYGINPDNHDLNISGMFRYYLNKIPQIIDLNSPLGQLHKVHMAKIDKFLNLFSHYLICLESSEQDKVHYQAILWSKEPLELYNTLDKLKQKYFPLQKTKYKQNSVSLTQAKNIKNLSSYVKKNKCIVKTNLNPSQIAMIPQWKSVKVLKEEWSIKLIKKIEECNKDNLTAKQTADIIVNYCWENERQHPTRNKMQYLLGKYHNNYGSENIVIGYNLFPQY